jgi:hypothetical protein
VLILGHHGVAATAAAGVLLTVTSVLGSLCYAAWGYHRPHRHSSALPEPGRYRGDPRRDTHLGLNGDPMVLARLATGIGPA